MQRVGLIRASQSSSWVSCRTIAQNLFDAYRGLQKAELIEFFLDSAWSHEEYEICAAHILESQLTHVVFIEHLPHPEKLLAALTKTASSLKKAPLLRFHIYGDFTFFAPEWLRALKEVRSYPSAVQFYCASRAQARLVESLLDLRTGSVSVCPFPVNTAYFKPCSITEARAIRKQLKFSTDELIITYTGRMSLQKNIHQTSELLSLVAKQRKLNIRMVCAGEFDDLGMPFLGFHSPEGSSFFDFHSLKRSIESPTFRMDWIGNLSMDELRSLYQASDAFISLSLYHDEDFGMAPAEALSCGLPCILSNWGGYSDFARPQIPVDLLNTELTAEGYSFDSTAFGRAFTKLLKRISLRDKMKVDWSHQFAQYFSLSSITKLIEDAPPTSLNPKDLKTKFLAELAEPMQKFRQRQTDRVFKNYRSRLYRKIYSNYIHQRERL